MVSVKGCSVSSQLEFPDFKLKDNSMKLDTSKLLILQGSEAARTAKIGAVAEPIVPPNPS
jgi:hypothetical protein